MIPFVRRADGVHLGLSSGERGVLTSLTEQLQQVLASDIATDPVSARMFPDAYRDDVEASAEFRRWTESDLVAQKTTKRLDGARLADRSAGRRVRTGGRAAWLRC